MTLLVFVYVYRIDMNIERLMPCSDKHNLHLKNILSSNNKSKQQSTFKSKQKYDKLSLQVQCPVQSDLKPSLSCFLLMLLTESLYIYFCQLHQSSIQLLVERALTYFFFILNSCLVYCYTSSTHCIYVFTFNSDILSFGMQNISKDSYSAPALRGKEGDIEGKTISLSL